ncbi:MAG: hypothetical protein K9H15_15355, partial [Bacteroidales bacterium]|nr:hypothetical protein [Bacteroidales bacterium]
MRSVFIILSCIIFSASVMAQNGVKARSDAMYVNITKDPPKPPYIEFVEGSLTFSDSDGNQIIDADEQARIVFQLKNSGMGMGLNLEAQITEQNGIQGIQYKPVKSIGTLDPGTLSTVEIPVSGTMNTPNATASFQISISEANGFGTDPVIIEVPVASFLSPLVKIVDYKITSQSGTTIEKRRPFEVQVLVQNVGQGTANDVALTLPVPENMFCLTDNTLEHLGTLVPGEQRLIEYSLVANNTYTASDIRLDFQVTEKHRRYGENRDLVIAMNQSVASEKLVIQGRYEKPEEIIVGSLTSAVDKNIPFHAYKNQNRIALIIGNEDYSGNLNAEINVAYAANDASVFRQYAVNTLGVPE